MNLSKVFYIDYLVFHLLPTLDKETVNFEKLITTVVYFDACRTRGSCKAQVGICKIIKH